MLLFSVLIVQCRCCTKYIQLYLISNINHLRIVTRFQHNIFFRPFWNLMFLFSVIIVQCRVADVEGAQERRSTKGQGLLRKEGPPTYAILSRNLVLSRFTPFLKGFHRAFNESHPAFKELSMKAIGLS